MRIWNTLITGLCRVMDQKAQSTAKCLYPETHPSKECLKESQAGSWQVNEILLDLTKLLLRCCIGTTAQGGAQCRSPSFGNEDGSAGLGTPRPLLNLNALRAKALSYHIIQRQLKAQKTPDVKSRENTSSSSWVGIR